ncbi:hypothetical protein ACFYZT_32100 [Streptomyces sp. NPDC001591]|uniref:hypothetical protein n=1 Tax=Streptomyces sp. NPDC001591 TaxID=3364589 RepID=UPI003680D44E
MSEITPEAKGPAPVQRTPEAAEPALIPAEGVNPEDIGTLSLRYVDGQPVIVVSGGTYIPAGLKVVDGSGTLGAIYTASPSGSSGPDAAARSAINNVFELLSDNGGR